MPFGVDDSVEMPHAVLRSPGTGLAVHLSRCLLIHIGRQRGSSLPVGNTLTRCEGDRSFHCWGERQRWGR